MIFDASWKKTSGVLLSFHFPLKMSGEASIDLNYRLMCKDCRKMPPNIVEDYKSGDLICGDCGLVFPGRIIDVRSEWRNFSNDSGGAQDDPSRVGAAENPLLEGVVDQLSTSISGMDGSATGQMLSRAQSKVTGGIKGDRDLMQSFRDISIMADRIGLPRVVGDRAKQLYKKVFDLDTAKGKPNGAIIAACLFLACRQEKVPRTFKEMTALTRVDKKILARCVKMIMPLLEDPMQMASTEDYLSRFCSNLDLPISVRNSAEDVVRKASELGILAGRSPLSIASAAIYMVSQLSDWPKSEAEISPVAGVTDATIRLAYRDLWLRRNDVLPKNFYFKLVKPVEELPIPVREVIS
jgi:transcription initiation factor TFIIB